VEEPRHKELHEGRIGIELEIIMAHEHIPGLMQCQWSVGFSYKAQHFCRKTVEQCTQPAPAKVGGRGSWDRSMKFCKFLEFCAREKVAKGMDHPCALRLNFMGESEGSAMAQYKAVKLAARSAAETMATFREAMKIRLDDYDEPVAKRGQAQPKQEEAAQKAKK